MSASWEAGEGRDECVVGGGGGRDECVLGGGEGGTSASWEAGEGGMSASWEAKEAGREEATVHQEITIFFTKIATRNAFCILSKIDTV